ncbi:MAG: SDR family NAD(P)-dependent oxidoreductase [Gemmatimonadetes bacterium]|nr:SDR family NAD(P)-dependent oxidoreductase [Gemmatimonadota bacterium]
MAATAGPLPALAGRVAVVTGASRGIGRAVATALAAHGAAVWLLARGAAEVEALAAELGPLARPAPCDVADAASLAPVLARLAGDADGPPDLLVNNAGIFPLGGVEAVAPDTFTAALAVNLAAPYRLLHALLPSMRARGRGDVVTIGSVADRRVFPGNAAYAPSKFGARALHHAVREETVGSGIRCVLVAPAATDTPLWDPHDPDHTPGLPSRATMLRPEDVADAVLWAVTRPPHVTIEELRLARS